MTEQEENVVKLLREMADLYGRTSIAQAHRLYAYHKAADALVRYGEIPTSRDDLLAIKDIGPKTADAVLTLLERGTHPDLERMRAKVSGGADSGPEPVKQ